MLVNVDDIDFTSLIKKLIILNIDGRKIYDINELSKLFDESQDLDEIADVLWDLGYEYENTVRWHQALLKSQNAN